MTVTPNGVDSELRAGRRRHDGYLLFVGAIQAAKEPALAALEAARAVGLPLVVAGPRRTRSSPARCATAAPRCAGYVSKEELAELYRGAACARAAVAVRGLRAAGARGDGLRDAGRRRPSRRCARSPATRPCTPRTATSALPAQRARPSASGSRAAGLERAAPSPGRRPRAAPPRSTARCSREGVGDRRLARERRRARAVAARARAAGRRAARDREHPGLRRRPRRRGARERRPLGVRRERQPRLAPHERRGRADREPGRGPEPGAVASAARVHGRPRALRRRRARGCSSRTEARSRRAAASRPSAARSSAARRCARSVVRRQRHHSTSTSRPRASRCRPTGCSAASCSCGGRCSTSSAASTPASGSTARTSTSSTGRCRRLGALVRSGGRRPARAQGRDRPALPHPADALALARGSLRFVRKHPETTARAAMTSAHLCGLVRT